MSKLLFDSYPIVVIPELAEAVGINQAIILQQIHYWIEHNKKINNNYHDGFYWVYNTYEEWRKTFRWVSVSGIKNLFKDLEKRELLITGNYNKIPMDRTKWYRINYENLYNLPIDKICTMQEANFIRAIPEDTIQKQTYSAIVPTHITSYDEMGSSYEPFDFSITERQIRKCYTNISRIALSVDEVVYIFKYFIDTHDIFCSYDHPHIKKETLVGLLGEINHCNDGSVGSTIDLTVECYCKMIDYYFTVEFENCNYSIVHFMSGDIRLNCWYKTCYYG